MISLQQTSKWNKTLGLSNIIISAYFNMASIFVGTAFNQLITIHSEDKRKTKTVYGAQARQPVLHISHDPYVNQTLYSTSKNIYQLRDDEVTEVAKIYGPQQIINVNSYEVTGLFQYILSNGAFHSSFETEYSLTPLYKGESHNLFTGAGISSARDQYLLYGKGVVPMVVNKDKSVVTWKGKNVKHDELDLQVPIHDVAGEFTNNDKFLAILNANNKIRIYDIRGTHKRPVKDLDIKTNTKTKLTCMKINHDQTKYYVGNEGGEVLELDSRKDFLMSAKYKGIASTITGLVVGEKKIITSSLDCYVRIFDIQQRKELKRFYVNKPIYSLDASFEQEPPKIQEPNNQQHYQQEIQLSQEEQQQQNKVEKVKHIRKRNKVGLKYLRPQEFDTPEEMPIKEEEGEAGKAWIKELNPIDRLQFQQQR